jgi:LPS sulfotransferase NodH
MSPPSPVSKTYLIASTPRSGSTMLAFGLGSTKIAGNPNEFLDANVVFNWSQQFGFSIRSYADYLNQLMVATCTPNGVFGVKTMWHSIQDTLGVYARTMPELASLPLYKQVDAMLYQPKYIFITREDKVRQAISLVKAAQTNVWIHWNKTPEQNAAPAADPVYNPGAIEDQINIITLVERTWDSFFTVASIKPYHVVYEDMVARYEEVILDVLRFLEIDLPPGFRVPEPVTAQQADRVSEEWYERFMSESSTARVYQPRKRRIDQLVEEENDELRRQHEQLQNEVERLTAENAQLQQALVELARQKRAPFIELLARSAYRNTVPSSLRLRLRDLRQGLRSK